VIYGNSLSFPVGRVTFEWMRPITFREFLLACAKETLAGNLPSVFRPRTCFAFSGMSISPLTIIGIPAVFLIFLINS